MAEKKRKYEESHRHINFELDLRRASPRLWVLLGRALASCEEVAAAYLKPEQVREMEILHLVRGIQSTTAIEGNTLTEKQVRARYEERERKPSPPREYQEIEVDNMLDVHNDIRREILDAKPPKLSPQLICEYNGRVLNGLEDHLDKDIVPGEIRKYSVGVGRYLAAPWQDCEYLLNRLCDWLEREMELPDSYENRSRKMADSILKGILVHLYIAAIHPFGDGNGRTSRLLEYMLLARGGVPMPSALLLSNYYNQTRYTYYQQLDQSRKANGGRGDVFGFLIYALEGFVKNLQKQCEEIQEHHLRLAWESYVSEISLQWSEHPWARRCREIAIALSYSKVPVPRDEILGISPKLQRLYVGKTEKAITRDLNRLAGFGLIEEKEEGYQASIELMRQFRIPSAGLADRSNTLRRIALRRIFGE